MLVIISNNTICIQRLFVKCQIRDTFFYLLVFGLKALERDTYLKLKSLTSMLLKKLFNFLFRPFCHLCYNI